MNNLMSGVGLILRRVRHRDEDVRLTLFMRDVGKVTTVIKGGQRFSSKLKALQQVFSEIDAQIYLPPHGFHGRLISGKLLSSHFVLGQRLHAFEIASQCCEAVEAIAPFRAPSPEVYDVLAQELNVLETAPYPSLEWIVFVLQLMKSLGHGDLTEKLLSHWDIEEQKPFDVSHLRDVLMKQGPSESSLNRSRAFVESELARHLSRPLKSTSLQPAGHF